MDSAEAGSLRSSHGHARSRFEQRMALPNLRVRALSPRQRIEKERRRYENEFFTCNQCSVVFLNPTQFNEFSTAAPSIEFSPIVTPLRRRK